MLPGEELPLRIFEPRYAALVRDCLRRMTRAFGVVLIAAGREVGGGDARSDVGTMAHIAESPDFGDGRYRLECVMARTDPGGGVASTTTPTRGPTSSRGPTSRVHRSTPTRHRRRRGPDGRAVRADRRRPRRRRRRARTSLGGAGRRGRCGNVVVRVGVPGADGPGRPVFGAGGADGRGTAGRAARSRRDRHRDGRVSAVAAS